MLLFIYFVYIYTSPFKSNQKFSDWVFFQELSKEVKFKYEFYLVEGGGYGSFKNGRWTGMIADLRAQKADMAVIDMSITSIRQTAVDFTMPYMTTG